MHLNINYRTITSKFGALFLIFVVYSLFIREHNHCHLKKMKYEFSCLYQVVVLFVSKYFHLEKKTDCAEECLISL